MSHPSPESESTQAKLRLNAGLRFIPQTFGNQWHCVIEDIASKRYFRIGRLEYLIASCLDGNRDPATILEVVRRSAPELDISKTDVENTFRWFASMGLVANQRNPDEELPAQVAPSFKIPDPFMLRIPILRGESLESWLRPLTFLVSTPAIAVQLLVMLVAVFVFFSNSTELLTLSAKLFVPAAASWWFMAWLLLKVVHELGHAIICMAYNGRLRGAGLGIFYLAPVPYVDTTDMWRLPNRRHRAYCAMGGMWFELTAAAVAILICQSTELSGLKYFCASVATLGSITTFAFNANPFTRFDGYYIASDILDRPNLWSEGQLALRAFMQAGWRGLRSCIDSEHRGLIAIYGAICTVYRFLMLITLAWGTWLTYRGIGVGLIATAAYLWFIGPWIKARRLAKSKAKSQPPSSQPAPSFAMRSVVWCRRGAIVAGVVALAYVAADYPSPLQPAAPGYVSYREPIMLRASSNGIVVEVFQTHDAIVDEGTPILRIENPELELQVNQLRRGVEILEEKCRVIRGQSVMAELQAEQARLVAAREQLALTESKWNDLIVKAPRPGRLIARQLDRLKGQSIKDGQSIAAIAASKEIEIQCSLAQEDVESFRSQVGKPVKLYFPGAITINGTLAEVMPRGSDTLDNPALAARFGGPVGVHLTSTTQEKDSPIKTLRPRFDARIAIDQAEAKNLPLGGMCRVRPLEHVVSIASLANRIGRSLREWLLPAGAEPII